MSTRGTRDFRPTYHFTPEKMWMNDPNGMIRVDEKWHLFYQFYPNDTKWGPMHWGHAVSEDLVTWEHLPVALAPDELGYIFSGSAILDTENRSGFGRDGKTPLVVMYTSCGRWQQQSIAYSLDGIHFEKYEGNPVIPNQDKKDFRDPKLFWNEKRQCFGVILVAGDHVEFYASSNLKEWEKTGEFTCEMQTGAVWECPDLFPVMCDAVCSDGKKEQKWILIVSTGPVPDKQVGSCTWYVVGEFDGDTFVADSTGEDQDKRVVPRRIDWGYDNYAGVTWTGTERPVFLGWASDWLYADKLPTGDFCGQMTYARQLKLEWMCGAGEAGADGGTDTAYTGWRLVQTPLLCPGHMPELQEIALSENTPDGMSSGRRKMTSEAVHLTAKGMKQGESIRLCNSLGQYLEIGINGQNCLYADRRHSLPGWREAAAEGRRTEVEKSAFDPLFASEKFGMAVSAPMKDFDLDIYWDHSILEVFADGGRTVMTMLAYPDESYTMAERVDLRGIKLAIFDMDGLMFDTENLFFEHYRAAAQECGYEITREFYLMTVGCNAEDVRRITEEQLGKDFPQQEIGEKAHERIRNFLNEHQIPVKKGLYEILEALKQRGIPCVIASSSAEDTIKRYLKSAGVEEYFVRIVNGNEVKHSKPEPDIFLKACRDSGVRPEEALVLEDSQNGILAAWRAGIPVICVPDMKYPDGFYAEKTKAICRDLDEVRELLRLC